MSQFCCKCGKDESKEKIVNGFCLSCFSKEFPLVLSFPDKQINITSCKLCGDLMFHGSWLEVYDEPKDVVMHFIREFSAKAKKVSDTELLLVSNFDDIILDEASTQIISLLFEGTPEPEVPPYQQEYPVNLVINVGVCERCARHAGGYYESIVQIRSDKRAINEKEQLLISDLIEQKKEEKAGNRMAFISKAVDQAKGGIDLYVGSEKFAKNLAKFIADNLAASIEYSVKLKTIKDGNAVYQATYCIRIPYFEIGDIVDYLNIPHQITGINFGRVELYNLKTKTMKTLSVKDSNSATLTVLKKKDQLQKFIIMAIQPPNVSIMNASTYETYDIDSNFIMYDHKDGDEIIMVELPEGLYECQKL